MNNALERTRRLREIGFQRGRFQSKFRYRNEPKTRFTKPIRRQCPWESLFMRKSKPEKRMIIQKPWELPMAAQHLSAILIQKHVRGMLCRLKIKQYGLDWLRKHLVRSKSQRHRFQSPIQRFVATGHGSLDDDLGFRNFAATQIQAWYRKERLRWIYTLQRFPVYHIAALQLQYAWKAHCQQQLYRYDGHSPRIRAAMRIQLMWKSYTNQRIYRYYRDLITFQNTGDPSMMLRAINPAEASLLDASMGAHVRFRLGGVSFPPTIYYKIYTRKPICDLNAFSPKDYTLARQQGPASHNSKKQTSKTRFIRVGNAYYRAKQMEEETKCWYKRMENNGWRPVTAKVVSEATNDPIAKATGSKPVANFHYSKVVRRQDVEKQRRLKKRLWMKKLYMQGLLKPDQEMMNDEVEIDFDSEQWEQDADEMFQWASALDYDEYLDEWHSLGKTASTDDNLQLPNDPAYQAIEDF